MNVREEDRQKNNCPSRGLGLAAAAMGVGVGAALYYFFSKRPENPDAGGSTTQWSCEQPHAFNPLHDSEETDSYITISENSTTDTSIFTSDNTDTEMMDTSDEETSYDDDSDSMFSLCHHGDSSTTTFSDSDNLTYSTGETSNVDSQSSNVSLNVEDLFGTIETPSFSNVINIESDPDTFDYDVTDSSIGVPDGAMLPPSPLLRLIENFGSYLSPRSQRKKRTPEEEQMIMLRDQAFRERSWSLEECSICFDVILKDHKVTTLPCTHHFHSECITPWLQEQQTCPNCRKAAE